MPPVTKSEINKYNKYFKHKTNNSTVPFCAFRSHFPNLCMTFERFKVPLCAVRPHFHNLFMTFERNCSHFYKQTPVQLISLFLLIFFKKLSLKFQKTSFHSKKTLSSIKTVSNFAFIYSLIASSENHLYPSHFDNFEN